MVCSFPKGEELKAGLETCGQTWGDCRPWVGGWASQAGMPLTTWQGSTQSWLFPCPTCLPATAHPSLCDCPRLLTRLAEGRRTSLVFSRQMGEADKPGHVLAGGRFSVVGRKVLMAVTPTSNSLYSPSGDYPGRKASYPI